jgi:hypothetical protein
VHLGRSSNAGAQLIGANTYAAWASYRPGDPGPFARAMNEIRDVRIGCYVPADGGGEPSNSS